MANRLLSLMLVATQLVSWNASPLYLCVGSEGSVCIDLGSENCNCCPETAERASACVVAHTQHPADTQRVSTRLIHEHDEDQLAPGHHDSHVSSAACECKHIQLLYQQGPVVFRGRTASDLSWLAHHFVAPACCLADGAGVAAFAAHSPPIDPLARAPFGLVARATVVLQC